MTSLTAADFEPYLGRPFRLSSLDLALDLDSILTAGGGAPQGRTPFTLIFRAPKTAPVAPEGLYTCAVEGGPSHDLYLIPIHTPDPALQEYQAVFN